MKLRCGLLGRRLSHSYSPLIHSELGDYEYLLHEVEPEGLGAFLREGRFDGLNVTIPYKKDVAAYCAGLSDAARAAGSVNTLTRLPDGTLFGDNTDCFGFARLLERVGADPAGAKAVVLGSGGASLAVQAVLRGMGAKEIVVVSRGGPHSYADIHKHGDAALLVNATPVGMYPGNGASPIADLGAFRQCRAVIDLVYNPARTELLSQAEERGMPCENGMAMLVAQAKRSAEAFTGKAIPDERIDEIIGKIYLQTLNIVLIGMPGCGKTSVGKALARMAGRGFADTDEWVARRAGKTPAAIIAEDGEDAFRALEHEAMAALCKLSGMVIATGGGVVARPENRRVARQNGTVVFLDRDVAQLPVAGRPISMRDGIGALAAARLPLYKEWCDHAVPSRGVERTAQSIHRLLLGR